jgi:glycerol-3-phosphate responsive antiterminator
MDDAIDNQFNAAIAEIGQLEAILESAAQQLHFLREDIVDLRGARLLQLEKAGSNETQP